MADILLDPLMLKDTSGVTVNPSTDEVLHKIWGAISAIRSSLGIASDLRTTILSGTVTTVTTVTGITNIGSNPAVMVVPNLSNTLYTLANTDNILRA